MGTSATRRREAYEAGVERTLAKLARRWDRTKPDELAARSEFVAALEALLTDVAVDEVDALGLDLPEPIVAAASNDPTVLSRLRQGVRSALAFLGEDLRSALSAGKAQLDLWGRSLVSAARAIGVTTAGSVAVGRGLETTYRWVLDPSCNHCPVCLALKDAERPANAAFDGGLSAPPAHPRCCCGLSLSTRTVIEPEGDAPVQASAAWSIEMRSTVAASGGRAKATAKRPPKLQTEDDGESPELEAEWQSVIAFEDVETVDGRLYSAGCFGWRELPIPLTWGATDDHYDDRVVGQVVEIERQGDELRAIGTFDLDDEFGREAARKVGNQTVRWVSVEYDPPEEWELVERGEEDTLFIVHKARIAKVCMVDHPAFLGCVIVPGSAEIPALAEDGRPAADVSVEASAIVACAAPDAPPAAFFADPGLGEPTPHTITADGRIYGHLYAWDSCHQGRPGACLRPPRDADLSAFMGGEVVTAEGTSVAVGQIIAGTGHAPKGLDTVAATQEWYDGRPGAVVIADVAVGADEIGVWYSGALGPITEGQLAQARARKLSADLRPDGPGGAYRLAAITAGILVAGWPIRRKSGAASPRVIAAQSGSRLVASAV